MKGSFVTASDFGIDIGCPEGKLNGIVIIAFHGSSPFTACVCHINDRKVQQLSNKTPMTSHKPGLHPFLLRFLSCLQELQESFMRLFLKIKPFSQLIYIPSQRAFSICS